MGGNCVRLCAHSTTGFSRYSSVFASPVGTTTSPALSASMVVITLRRRIRGPATVSVRAAGWVPLTMPLGSAASCTGIGLSESGMGFRVWGVAEGIWASQERERLEVLFPPVAHALGSP